MTDTERTVIESTKQVVKRRHTGLVLFLIGLAAAAAWTIAGQSHQAAQVTLKVSAPDASGDRIRVSPLQLAQAYSAGTVDHPIRSILNVPKRMSYGDFFWNEKGVPAGPVWIRVDLRSQIISVFRAGDEIGTAVILYGADGVPTPIGKFPILAKLRNHRSATYGEAPMPYTLRLTSDGVSIHGSNVRWGFATHGCIGVPTKFAARLFDAVNVGDVVTISRA